ncbi:hypothetical protein K1719_034439 [Acacia pycnantha]|nr:hypothetical protein K1719_034439 [Acacia pycnantha]
MEFAISSSIPLSVFLFRFLLLSFFTAFPSKAHLIPREEVEALQAISDKLTKVKWKVTPTSCVKGDGFNDLFTSPPGVTRNVTCNCTFQNGTVCHVTNILLKRQNIAGEIPSEFGNLTHLTELDLYLNYFNGTIPTSFRHIPLVTLSLSGNPISGSIPTELGEIATLKDLSLEGNQLGGPLPHSLGNLSFLRRIRLSANNFTGTIPETYGNLKNMIDFSIDGSTLSRKIPSFIGNWTKILYMDMEGTGMEGPIPSTISLLTNLKELRISDLKGTTTMAFPKLKNLKSLKRLILRNCLITGPIPMYIGEMTNLKTLDLSFNMLAGSIPDSFRNLNHINHMFLTNNSLSGAIPDWVLQNEKNIDLSYNNFTKASTSTCQILQVNLASSLSSSVRNATFCLKKGLTCPSKPQYYSLFINSGGPNMEIEEKEYEEDSNQDGISYFYRKDDKWAYSKYYQTARLSPQSLKYYGLCMMKGSYKVKLHFAEIMFSDDQTFNSLGTRIFDVSIQGFKYLKDFNIAKEAHFLTLNEKGFSAGAIVGIVLGLCVFLMLVVLITILRKNGFLGGKDPQHIDLKGLDLKTGMFTLKEIKAATNNFNADNKIGEGGFGPVFKGILPDGRIIAVKKLSAKSRQGNREFLNEVCMIFALHHPCLVKLYGCCVEGDQLLLVYEFMDNNSLARALFGLEEFQLKLEWPTRHKICVGIARGLVYLHEESRFKIVHRDIKASNILLDKDLNPKISDFGLAKLYEEENTHISTKIAGTRGYMAPEYAMHGYLTKKADIYSFGIVALEIISGKTNTTQKSEEECFYLRDWAHQLKDENHLMDLVDPKLGEDFNREEIMTVIDVALQCTENSPALRSTMTKVLSILEGRLAIQEVVLDDESEIIMDDDLKLTKKQ